MSNRNPHFDPSFPYQIPVGRVKAVIEEYIEKYIPRPVDAVPGKRHGIGDVARTCGFKERQITAWLNEEYQSVTFNSFEKLLIGLGILEMLNVPPELGGFADLYECVTVQPPLPPVTEKQHEVREKRMERHRANAA